MNINFCFTMNYEQKAMKYENKNKAQSNPTCSEIACPASPEQGRGKLVEGVEPTCSELVESISNDAHSH